MAKSKMTKKDIKQPDQFQKTSAKIWTWAENNIVSIILVGGGVFAVGLGGVLFGQYQMKQDVSVQGDFYKIEKPFLEKKADFAEAKAFEASLERMKPEEKSKALAENKDMKKPSGDIDKDYGELIGRMRGFISANKTSNSAILAALHLVETYAEYKKTDESLAVLKELSPSHEPTSMLGGVLWTQLGNVQAEKGDCDAASATWQSVVAKQTGDFLKKDLRLRVALCSMKKDPARAKEELKTLALDFPESASGRSAKKYLRLMESGQSAN